MESLTHLNIVSKGQSQSNFSQRTPTAASYPDVSLLMKMCAQRKAGRRQRACYLYPSHGPLRFITSHSRFALASAMRKTKRLRRRLHLQLVPVPLLSFFTPLLSNSENGEHLKNFRNVDCLLANHNEVQDTQANLKTTN